MKKIQAKFNNFLVVYYYLAKAIFLFLIRNIDIYIYIIYKIYTHRKNNVIKQKKIPRKCKIIRSNRTTIFFLVILEKT